MKFFFDSSMANEALAAKKKYIEEYGQHKAEDADIIIPIGGDGFLLKSLHDYNNLKKPFFGINYGSIGFLMNTIKKQNIQDIIKNAKKTEFKPLI